VERERLYGRSRSRREELPGSPGQAGDEEPVAGPVAAGDPGAAGRAGECGAVEALAVLQDPVARPLLDNVLGGVARAVDLRLRGWAEHESVPVEIATGLQASAVGGVPDRAVQLVDDEAPDVPRRGAEAGQNGPARRRR